MSPHLHALIEELRRYDPEWGEQLARVGSDWELQEALLKGFNLSRHAKERFANDSTQVESLSQKIPRFLADNLHLGPTLKHLSQFLGYSEKYCSDLFQLHMGRSFSHYMRDLRVRRAKQLLSESSRPIAIVAESLGFSDQFAFSHFFKKATGYSPSHYRRRCRSRSIL
jgi:AraC-like DNA-binding protein